MASHGNFPGVLIVVLCQSAAQISCGDFSADPAASDTIGGSGGDGASDGTNSGGQSTGGQQNTGSSGTGGATDTARFCTGQPTAIVTIAEAPIDGGACLLSLEVLHGGGAGEPTSTRVRDCSPRGENCVCTVWEEGRSNAVNQIRLLDEDGKVIAEYSEYFVPVLVGLAACYAPPSIEITYTLPANAPPEQTSCIVSGVEEFCAPGEGCCSCGCAVVTDTCLGENICPPHEGPSCGEANCRAGMICCNATDGTCATSEKDCPVAAL